MRRIGVLMSTASDHLESKARLAAFLQRLQELGWVDGRTVQIDVRWPGSDTRIRSDAAELAALAPDVILATGTSGLSLMGLIGGMSATAGEPWHLWVL